MDLRIRLTTGRLRQPRRLLGSVVAAALAAALAVGAGPAGAQGKGPPSGQARPKKPADQGPKKDDKNAKYAIEVMVLHATNSKKGIDKRIGKMPELKKPPFSAYDSYEFLKSSKLPLLQGEAKTVRLPNKRVLKTTLLQALPEKAFRISASVNHPGGKDFLPLLEVKAKIGQRFIVAGQSYKGGILVLVLRLTEV